MLWLWNKRTCSSCSGGTFVDLHPSEEHQEYTAKVWALYSGNLPVIWWAVCVCETMKFQIVSLILAVVAYPGATLEISTVLDAAGSPKVATLGCHRRLYTYRVTQTDHKGRECWDSVSVMSCWGRCDSNEISDWKFPYKRSYHPVCVHAGRSPAVAILKNCHPDVEPETRRYHYTEAIACHCQTCSTQDTSCEAPRETHDETAVKVLTVTGTGSEADLDY